MKRIPLAVACLVGILAGIAAYHISGAMLATQSVRAHVTHSERRLSLTPRQVSVSDDETAVAEPSESSAEGVEPQESSTIGPTDTSSSYLFQKVTQAALPASIAGTGVKTFHATNTWTAADYGKTLTKWGVSPPVAKPAGERVAQLAARSVTKRLLVLVSATSAAIAVYDLANTSNPTLLGSVIIEERRESKPWLRWLVGILAGSTVLGLFIVAQRRGIAVGDAVDAKRHVPAKH